MIGLKKLSSWFVLVIILLTAFNAPSVSAQEDFIVTVGEDKVFTKYNYHDVSWEGTWDNGESIPYGPGGKAVSQTNHAQAWLSATASHWAVAEAVVGLEFEWDLGQYTWEEVKDWPVKVTINFSYGIYAGTADGNGFAKSGVNIVGFSDPWLDFLSYEIGQVGWDSHDTCENGSCYMDKTYLTTIDELDRLDRKIALLIYSQVDSGQDHDLPEGTVTHCAHAEVDINSIKIEFVTPPTVEITKVKMVSPTELGIAIKVWFSEDSQDNRRFVKFTATISGQPVEEEIDITDYTQPGKEVEIGVDINGNLDPDTPLRIDLKKRNVNRFTKNEKFELTASAYIEDGIQSDPDMKEVEILLPVVIIHGIMAEPGSPIPVWLQRFLNPFLSKPLTYWPLIRYLEGETRGDFITGYDIESETAFGAKKYRTLWAFRYNSVTGTSEEVAANLETLINQITNQEDEITYANKVNLIGHSLGGLVGRYYTATHGGSDKIHRLIMVGTPNNGSSRFYTQSSGWSKDRVENTLNRMPFLRWFIPTYDALYEDYDDYSNNPLIPFINNSFPDDPPPENVTYHNIYGISQKTPSALIVDIKRDWYVVEWKEVRRHWKNLSSPGDRTVPEEGAKLPWEEANIPVNNRFTHALLPADPEVRRVILYECLLQDN